MTINYMDIREFRELGYLQEVNRMFFHPLGLALEALEDDDGTMTLSGVWDYRDDPEGIRFGDGDYEERKRKADYVHNQIKERREARQDAVGYWIQPLENRCD